MHLCRIFLLFVLFECALATGVDHDVFVKQAHLHELGIQIQHMHDKLYAKCPTVFETPDSISTSIVGRRRSVETTLDLKIWLAEKTLEDLILQYGKCHKETTTVVVESTTETTTPPAVESTTETTTPPAVESTTETTTPPSVKSTTDSTTPSSVESTTETTTPPSVESTTETSTPPSVESTTETTTPPSVESITEATTSTFETIYPQTTKQMTQRHAFTVLRSRNLTYQGFDFLLIEVRVPVSGVSRSSNWCRDYQLLCDDFHRLPTGCGVQFYNIPPYSICRERYNSDMNIGDTLNCNPSVKVAELANMAFPDLLSKATFTTSFGFHICSGTDCQRFLNESSDALSYVTDFSKNRTTFYTICH